MLQLAGGGGNELFAVEVVYGDALSEQETSARFSAHRRQDEQEWRMYAVGYRRSDGTLVTVRRFG